MDDRNFDSWIFENGEGAERETASGASFPFRSFLWDGKMHPQPLLAFGFYYSREQRRVNQWLAAKRTRLVHLHYFADYYLHFAAARLPMIITLHGSDVRQDLAHSQLLRRIARHVFSACQRIILPSASLAADFLEMMPEFQDRTEVVLNGVHPARPKAPTVKCRGPFILCTGNLQRVKGQDILIRAFERVHHSRPEYRLCLAGDGPERESLSALIKSLNLEDRVALLGKCPAAEVRYLVQKCTLYAQPSRSEGGHPLAVMEAMLAGRAVVAARAGGLAEMIHDEKNGLLCDSEDPEALAEVLLRLIRRPALRSRLAKTAERQANGLYTRAAMGDRYRRIYEETLHARVE